MKEKPDFVLCSINSPGAPGKPKHSYDISMVLEGFTVKSHNL